MRVQLAVLAVGWSLLAAPAWAQVQPELSAAGAVGALSSRWGSFMFLGAAGGLEAVMTERFAAGAELAYFVADGVGVSTVSGTGRIRFPSRRVPRAVPFVVAGITGVGGGGFGGLSVGGGVDLPMTRRRAFRVEVRDTLFGGAESHFVTVRLGVTFR